MATHKWPLADIMAAERYVNELLRPLDLVSERRYVRAPLDITYHLKGAIEFRVRKENWPRLDTQKLVLKRLTARLGPTSTGGAHASTQAYTWDIGDHRFITLSWVYGRGTFIKLIDAAWRHK